MLLYNVRFIDEDTVCVVPMLKINLGESEITVCVLFTLCCGRRGGMNPLNCTMLAPNVPVLMRLGHSFLISSDSYLFRICKFQDKTSQIAEETLVMMMDKV